jgi:hypothetical protein
MLTPFMVAANRNANALSQLVFDARTTALQLVCLCEPGTPAHKIAMALSAAADRAEKSAQ